MNILARLSVILLPLAASACISPVQYGDIRHADYVANDRCNPGVKPQEVFSDKPFFLVTSRLADCRTENVKLLEHRGDRVRYGRFAEPGPLANEKGKLETNVAMSLENKQQWWDDLGKAVSGDSGRILLYVHGYKETFLTSAKDAAQIARMTDLDVTVVHYSWPSQGELLKYAADETNMYWDQANFRRFLTELAQQPWTKEIILVSHSLGARLVIPAVEYVDRTSANVDSSNISNIILASPDVDKQDFERDIAEQVLTLKRVNNDRRITIYASAVDQALSLSYRLHGYPRLGHPMCFDPFEAQDLINEGYPARCYAGKSTYDSPPEKSGLTIVDTTAVSADRTGHTDYLKSPAACADFIAVATGDRKGSKYRQDSRLSYVFTLPKRGKDEVPYPDVCLRDVR